MEIQKSLSWAVVSVTLLISLVSPSSSLATVFKDLRDNQTYTIDRTWDNKTTPDNASISISFSIKCDEKKVKNLLIEIDAPFYNDPASPNATTTDPFPGLWNYEVVEAFFLGDDDQYLEIELAPSGHYLLLYLNGYRNNTNATLPLTSYMAHLMNSTESNSTEEGLRWHGHAMIPFSYFPTNVTRFNAYAIHNSEPNRVYMSLFPVDQTQYPNQTAPDFHFLEAFEPIDFEDSQTCTSDGNGAGGAGGALALFGWLLSTIIIMISA